VVYYCFTKENYNLVLLIMMPILFLKINKKIRFLFKTFYGKQNIKVAKQIIRDTICTIFDPFPLCDILLLLKMTVFKAWLWTVKLKRKNFKSLILLSSMIFLLPITLESDFQEAKYVYLTICLPSPKKVTYLLNVND